MLTRLSQIYNAVLRGTAKVFGDLIPGTNNAYDLGQTLSSWRDLRLTSGIRNGTDNNTRLSVVNDSATIVTGDATNSGTNTAVSIRNAGGTLSGSTRIIDFHNDSAAASAEAYVRSDGAFFGHGVVEITAAALNLAGNATDGGTAIGTKLYNVNALSTAGAKITSFYSDNATTEKAYVDKDGQVFAGAGTGAAASVRVGGALEANPTGVGNLGASGPDDLQTYTLPANTLVQANRGIRVRAYGTTANNANAKTVRLMFGGTAVITKQLTASIAGRWELEAVVLRTGASTQDVFGKAINYGGTTVSSTDGATVALLSSFAAATETETGTIAIKTQSTTTTADNDIISEGLIVEYL